MLGYCVASTLVFFFLLLLVSLPWPQLWLPLTLADGLPQSGKGFEGGFVASQRTSSLFKSFFSSLFIGKNQYSKNPSIEKILK